MIKKIVLIEDDTIIRENISDFLRLHNFNVEDFENGTVALQSIKLVQPDLILCDIMLPGLSGDEILKEVRQYFQDNQIPFIFLSAKADKKDIRRGMDHGADDYLTKPFTLQELLRSIQTRLDRNESTKKQLLKGISDKLDNFVKILFHELNTPLNGILGISTLLKNNLNSYSKEDLSQSLDAIIQSTKRLSNTQKKIISFFNVLETQISKETEIIYLKDIYLAIKFYINSLNQPNIKFEAEDEIQESNVSIKLNSDYLLKIIDELTENAIKYGALEKPIIIKLTYKKVSQEIEIDVTNFIKNTEEVNLRTDNSFINLEKSLKGNQGFGLGLLIVQRIAEINNFKVYSRQIQDRLSFIIAIRGNV